MNKRLTLFIEENQILSQSQYGFRKNHSTQHAILDIVNTVQSNMDAGLFSCGVFIDLKKPSTPLTIPYYCVNYITTVYAELSTIGFLHIYLIGSKLLKLDPASLVKGK